ERMRVWYDPTRLKAIKAQQERQRAAAIAADDQKSAQARQQVMDKVAAELKQRFERSDRERLAETVGAMVNKQFDERQAMTDFEQMRQRMAERQQAEEQAQRTAAEEQRLL